MFRAVIILMLFLVCFDLKSQGNSLSYAEQLAALEAEMDSLSIFNLIENVMALEFNPESELNLHLGFTSSVTSAGRDYDLDQKGLAPGISYYHKSGVFTDVTGYWNSDVEPNYNPTIWSVGYLGDLSEKWNYSLDYERWFFNPNDSSDNPLRNGIGASITYDFKFAELGVDYSILFGDETAHRILGSLSKNIQLGPWWIFENISLYPNTIILFGNASITQLRITQQQLSNENQERLQTLIEFSELTRNQRLRLWQSVNIAFEDGRISESERDQYRNLLLTSRGLTDEQKSELQTLLEEGFEESIFEVGNAFGLMNYSFSFPISLSVKRLSIVLNYTYSIPVSLSGEFFEVDPIGYFGASISYRIPFK